MLEDITGIFFGYREHRYTDSNDFWFGSYSGTLTDLILRLSLESGCSTDDNFIPVPILPYLRTFNFGPLHPSDSTWVPGTQRFKTTQKERSF